MTPDEVEGIDAECRVIHDICREFISAWDDIETYTWNQGITKPRGTNWVELSESICQQLASDIEVRVRRMAERAGVSA